MPCSPAVPRPSCITRCAYGGGLRWCAAGMPGPVICFARFPVWDTLQSAQPVREVGAMAVKDGLWAIMEALSVQDGATAPVAWLAASLCCSCKPSLVPGQDGAPYREVGRASRPGIPGQEYQVAASGDQRLVSRRSHAHSGTRWLLPLFHAARYRRAHLRPERCAGEIW